MKEFAEYQEGSIHATQNEPEGFEVPDWEFIKAWTSNYVLRTSLIWLAIVPIAVSILKGTESTFIFLGTEPPMQFNLDLPFKWGLLYVAGLFGVCGLAIFYCFCPKCIRDFMSYQEYSEQGYDLSSNIEYVLDVAMMELKWNQWLGKINVSSYIIDCLSCGYESIGVNSTMRFEGKEEAEKEFIEIFGDKIIDLRRGRAAKLRSKLHPLNIKHVHNKYPELFTIRRLHKTDPSAQYEHIAKQSYRSLLDGASKSLFCLRLLCATSLFIASICYLFVFVQTMLAVVYYLIFGV